MDVRIQSIKFDASEKLVAFINKKAERLQRHYPTIISADFKLTVVKPESANNKQVVVKVAFPGGEYVADKTADTFEEAVDVALEAIDRKMEKSKDK